MARLTAGLVFGFLIGVVAGAAAGLHADEDEVTALAAETGVDATDLRGAVNTVGVSPRQYLQGEGVLPPNVYAGQAGAASVSPPGAASVSTLWAKLAQCESTGRWSLNSGNGFFGGLQFDRGTWLAYGGGAYAPTANLASPSAQIAVAEKLHAARGFAPWPACSRALGLR